MSAEELELKFRPLCKISGATGDSIPASKEAVKIAREYHAKEMDRVLEEAKEEMSGAFKNTTTHVFYEDGWIDGANWALTHLKEQKQDKG